LPIGPIASRRAKCRRHRDGSGLERNVVITQWDWADPKAYLHDLVSTDRRNPTLNANGLIYGSLELSADYLPVLDPVHNTTSRVPLTFGSGTSRLRPPMAGRRIINGTGSSCCAPDRARADNRR